MPRVKKEVPPGRLPEENSPIERLIEAVESVAAQLQVIKQILDDIREDFSWAISNRDHIPCPDFIKEPAGEPMESNDLADEEDMISPHSEEISELLPSSSQPVQQRDLWGK